MWFAKKADTGATPLATARSAHRTTPDGQLALVVGANGSSNILWRRAVAELRAPEGHAPAGPVRRLGRRVTGKLVGIISARTRSSPPATTPTTDEEELHDSCGSSNILVGSSPSVTSKKKKFPGSCRNHSLLPVFNYNLVFLLSN